METEREPIATRGGKWGLVLGGALLVALLYAVTRPGVERWIGELGVQAAQVGVGGLVLFGLVYVVATVAMIPGTILGLLAGFLFGPVTGVLVVSPASVLGATLAFLISRSSLRRRFEDRIRADPRFSAVDEAVSEDGFKVVLLLRLSPIFPFNLLNYALGLMDIRLVHYVVASFVGMLPGTAAIVYFGSIIGTLEDLFRDDMPAGGSVELAISIAGVAATILVVVVITRLARKALSSKIKTTT